jgi:CRISPR-associated protein Csd1
MFVQALAAYADENLRDELNDAAFEERAVPYYLSIAADGRCLGVIPRFESVAPASGKGKPKQRSQTHRVPRSPVNRNAGQHPMLAADEIGYVLGPGPWTKPADTGKVIKLHQAFVTLINRVAAETQDEALLACSRFYANGNELQKAITRLTELDAAPGSNLALYYNGEPVIDRQPVQLWWRRHYETSTQERASADVAECLISGVVGPIPQTHPKIKHTAALGGQPSGVSLMSFDKGAFRSYGWEQNANSPVSADRAMAYVLALNSLLKPGSPNRRDFGDVAFLFWLRKDSPLNPAEMLDETPTHALIEEVQRVIELNRHAWIDDANEFYMAAVSANGSRLILRSWVTELLPVAADNVVAWWKGLQMQPFSPDEPLNTPRFWQLLYAIEREGKPAAGRIVDLRRRALLGRRAPLGHQFIADVLQRMKVDPAKRIDLAALGLLRLCLNDLYHSTGEGEPMPPSLDPKQLNPHPAYVCGQLLAIHDYLQWKTFDTAGESQPNSTVADRFYNLVMNSPAVGMEKVFTLGRKHVAKLRKLKDLGASAAFGIEQQIGQLELQLGSDIPPRFGMHDKARFALGFYHQKAYRPKKVASSAEAPDQHTSLSSADYSQDLTSEKESAQ